MQQTVANPQLDRHQPSIRNWDPAHLLGPEGVAVESHSALGALNDNVGSDWHEPSLDCQHRELSNAVAAQHCPHGDGEVGCSCRKPKVCRNVGPSQEPVHDVKADGPMVRMSESFRDGGENREA